MAGLSDDNNRRENSMLALTALAAVTLVDVVSASGLTGEKGGSKTAIANYSGRSGFPQGVHAARGAAQDFKVPADFRTPEPLRPWVHAHANQIRKWGVLTATRIGRPAAATMIVDLRPACVTNWVSLSFRPLAKISS